MDEYDFFETPVIPYTILQDGAEVTIHVRDTDTMEQSGVKAIVSRDLAALPEGHNCRLHVYGRLGEKISSDWYMHVLEDLDEAALATDHELAQSMDMEQSLGSAEKFKESRYRKREQD
jgi:hypothetical protein